MDIQFKSAPLDVILLEDREIGSEQDEQAETALILLGIRPPTPSSKIKELFWS